MHITDDEDMALLGIMPLSDGYAKMAAIENALFDLGKRMDAQDAALAKLIGSIESDLAMVKAFDKRRAEEEAAAAAYRKSRR